jgi:asparaginyl-tRNA synthetase
LSPPKSWEKASDHYLSVLNHPWYRHIVKIQHEVHTILHNFFTQQGLVTVLMPITTASISSPMGLGSDSLPVEIDLFGVKTYLADSMQFMLEFGCRLHEPGVYYIMPCFRGEKTDQYHLPQFYHVEAEIVGDIRTVINLVNKMLYQLSLQLLQRCHASIVAIAGSTDHIEAVLSLNEQYPEYRMDEIGPELQQENADWVKSHAAGFDYITRSGEAELIRRNHGAPVWITHFDHLSTPFYQAYEQTTGRALNADLLLGSCEVVGAGQRHITREQVQEALDHHKVSTEPYSWYMRMRDERSLETSGFGMGLERYMLWLLQQDDIRDIPLLYRENGLAVTP